MIEKCLKTMMSLFAGFIVFCFTGIIAIMMGISIKIWIIIYVSIAYLVYRHLWEDEYKWDSNNDKELLISVIWPVILIIYLVGLLLLKILLPARRKQ